MSDRSKSRGMKGQYTPLGVGNMREYREGPDDDSLPSKYRHRRTIADLIRIAEPKGYYVASLGGERYTLSDERGRVLWRDGSFGEVEHILKYGLRKGASHAHSP